MDTTEGEELPTTGVEVDAVLEGTPLLLDGVCTGEGEEDRFVATFDCVDDGVAVVLVVTLPNGLNRRVNKPRLCWAAAGVAAFTGG